MRHALILLSMLLGVVTRASEAPKDPPTSAATQDFEGVWIGQITAPNTTAEFGLAFTRTERGLLVSVHLPEMFLTSVNFGPAQIREGVFTLPALNLTLSHRGERLAGTFAPAGLPVELGKGGSFSPAPPEPAWPVAPEPAWVRPLGAGAWAGPATFGGILYVATVDGRLQAVRAADGAGLWTWTGPQPLYGEPLATEDAVYIVDERCELVALSRADGTLRWRFPLHDESFGREAPARDETFNHRAASPVIDPKGILYVGSTDGGLYAIRARTGRKLWRHEAGARIHAAVSLQGDQIFAGCFDGSVIAVDRRSARETFRTKLGGAIVSTPLVVADRIVVGARDYLLRGLTRRGDLAWQNTYWFSWVESTPRLDAGTLYIGGSDYRRVSALDPKTGRVFWATDVRGLSWGTPVVTADKVFAGTAGQNLAGTVIQHRGGIVALDRTTGAMAWRYESPEAPEATFTGFAGSLVQVNDLVVGAAVDGTLIAFPAGR